MKYKVGQEIVYAYNFINGNELRGKIKSIENSFYMVYSYLSDCIIPLGEREIIRGINNSIRKL